MIANGNMKNPYLLKTEWRIIIYNCTFQAERVKFQLFIQKEKVLYIATFRWHTKFFVTFCFVFLSFLLFIFYLTIRGFELSGMCHISLYFISYLPFQGIGFFSFYLWF